MGLGMDIDSMVYGDFENDADLEAELRALQEEDEGGHCSQRQGAFGGARALCFIEFSNLLLVWHDVHEYKVAHKNALNKQTNLLKPR